MSHNQARAERSESTQYWKTGRSGSSNQQRQFSGGVFTKGGGGASSAPTNPSNRSLKKYNSNAQVGQPIGRSPNVGSSNSPAASAVQNGAPQQQQTYRASDVPITSTSSIVKPTDPTQKNNRAVPRAPSSNVSSATAPSNVSTATSQSKAPITPVKGPGDASKSFPLQFGSISPGFMNGMQIPARTSSAPPNLDEQKKDQGRHESLRATPAIPIPSIPKQHLPKKDAGILDQPNAGEAQLTSKSKRDAQVSAALPVNQAQKPWLHPMAGVPMQVPFHQPQVPVQFGVPNPQIQSQGMSGTSLAMPMPMSLPLGNPPVQHSMFVPGLQPHPMQSQGLMHQGQSLNFSPPMGPQLPPQLGNTGMNMAPQFPQQPALNYSGSRKTVKITHPETHEELRLDSSPAPRLQPNMQSQSLPISSFPSNIPMNFYPSSYSTTPIFLSGASSVPLNSTQVLPTSQPPRFYNQVTVKPPIASHGEKEPLPPVVSVSVSKAESLKPSRLQGEDSISPYKEIEPSSLSSSPQPKPGLGTSNSSAATSGPYSSASASALSHASASASTNSTDEPRTEVVVSDSINDKYNTADSRGQQDQVGRLLSAVSSLPSQLPEAAAMAANSPSNLVSKTAKGSSSTTVAAFSEASSLTGEGAPEEKRGDTAKGLGTRNVNSTQSKPETMGRKEQGEGILSEGSNHDKHGLETSFMSLSLESPKTTRKIEESSDQKLTYITGGLSELAQEKPEESSGFYSDDVKMDSNIVVQNNKTSSSDAPLILPDGIDTSETTVEKSAPVNQESASVVVPSSSEVALRPEKKDIDSNSADFASPSPCGAKDAVLPDTNVVKTAIPRVKNKKKELYRRAEAAGMSSDLYMAYKGPEEKKVTVTSAEGSENTSSTSEKQTSADVSQENAVSCAEPAQSKVEPDDWEDAAEISSPQLDSKNENQDNDEDGYGLMIKRYSRDFLLKFVEQCTDLPEGFEITSDIADTLMVSSVDVSWESYPSPGRSIDRSVGVSRPDRRGSGFGDDDRWSKFPGPLVSGRGDVRTDFGYGSNIVGFRPGQGGNYGVLRNPRAQLPVQYAGGILSGPIQSFGPQGGLQRINSDSDRWQRGTGFQKGLMPSPQTPIRMMHKAEKKYEVGRVTDEEEANQRQLKAILNKLTPQNFEKLFQQVKQVNIDNVITLSGVIAQIFDKALMEPTFCEMYANFCFHLAADLPDLIVDNEKITFKRLLLNKCQEEFERGEREEEEANKAEEGEIKQTAEEREEKRLRARRRMLGNIRLIGELYKKRMLTERIMHVCINKLLGQDQNPDEENIEALCILMTTIGEMIDHPKAKEHMDAYFDIMGQLSSNTKLSSRVRFMLKDAIDLRKNKWQQRRKVEGPKKIEEVHRDAAQERQAQAGGLACVPGIGSSVERGGPPMDFAPRSSSILSSPSSQIGGFRAVPPQLRGYGSQDIRIKERHYKAEKKCVGRVADEEAAKQRQLKAILNKLTPQNFGKLLQQVRQVNINNIITLCGVVGQIFDIALMQPTLCEMCANFSFHLAAYLPDLSVDNQRITFKRLLLNKCQEEFERGEREEEEANKAEEEGEIKQTAEEREEKRLRARTRMLGNIRLIGELYKKRMLTERIMHECIDKLLGQYQKPDEENIEALCILMSTIGEMIDHPKAKEHMDAYFDIMGQLSNNTKLSSRVRFMLKNAIDLRKNKWQQRRKVEGPKEIEKVHRDAAQERQAQASRLARVPIMGSSVRSGGPPMNFAPRSPSILSSPSSQIGSFRAVPPQLRGYGSQDIRTGERRSAENRTMSVPLPQRAVGDDSIIPGPHGGLGRGVALRGLPSAPSIALSEMPSPADARRMGPGQNGFRFSSMPERAGYGQREDIMPRHMPDRLAAAPIYDRSHAQEQNTTYGNREVRNTDWNFDTARPNSPLGLAGPPTSMHNVSSDEVWLVEHLRDKSVAAIKEFYSARDGNEVALCIKDLNAPSFYPSMISIWVTDSFERKDMERDLLTKLLINLSKPREGMISEEQLIKGFESVLAVLEDAVNDAPKAAEFLGRIFAKVILENVVSLSEIGRLIYEGGEEQGRLVEIGLAAEILGSILDIIKSEKCDSVLNEILSSSNLRLENFRPPDSRKTLRIDKFI